MRRLALAAVAALLLLPDAAPAQIVDERDKIAQTGMKFLSVVADPRAAAMGSAATALEGGAEMLFSNPAGMARLGGATDLMVGQTEWIAGIDYNHGALAINAGNLGVVGVTLAFVDYGEFTETIYADNEDGYLTLGTFSPQAWSAGVGYARALSGQFSVGGQVKYAAEDLGASLISYNPETGPGTEGDERQENTIGTLAYDFGVLYKTGFESLNFAVSARNFSQEIELETESFQLPLALHIGVSMDVLDLAATSDLHSLVLAVDAENPRDFQEQIKIGGEYTFADAVSFRAGYVYPTDEQGIQLGAGFRQDVGGLGLGADYAYTDFGVFNNVHRVALRLSF